MGNKSFHSVLGIVLAALLAGCVKQGEIKKASAPIRKIAVVSIAINPGAYLGMSARSQSLQSLVGGELPGVVRETEIKLASIMQVTRIAGFIASPGFRSLGVKNENPFILPEVNGKSMIFFSAEKDDVKAGVLKPEVAKKLCADLKVDGVALVYSEWTAERGKFVPQHKPYTENVVTVWDRSGNKVFDKRVDAGSEREMGVGVMRLTPAAMKEWSTAYARSLDEIVKEMKNLTL